MDFKTLQNLVIRGDDPMATWTYFLTGFLLNPEFHQMGRPVQGADVLDTFAGLCAGILGKQVARVSGSVTLVPQHDFVHAILKIGR